MNKRERVRAAKGPKRGAPPDEQRARAFLDAFAGIEDRLHRLTRTTPKVGFSQIVSLAIQRHRSLAELEGDLLEWAELRNAIVHQRGGGQLIADPYPAVVERSQEVLRVLDTPPTVLDALAEVDVVALETTASVAAAAHMMLAGVFSQLPIYRNGRFIGLLTAETITRWLASRLDEGLAADGDTSIGDVLPYTEDPDNVRFLGPEASAFEALDLFDHFANAGRSLDAILIAEGKRRDAKPRSIATVFDIPRLLGALRDRGLGTSSLPRAGA